METRLNFTCPKSRRQYIKADIGLHWDILLKSLLCAQTYWECYVFYSNRRQLTLSMQLSFQSLSAEASLTVFIPVLSSKIYIVVRLIYMYFLPFCNMMTCFTILQKYYWWWILCGWTERHAAVFCICISTENPQGKVT